MSPTIKIVGFGAQGHVQKSRNHRNDGFEGSRLSKSKSYKFKLEQTNTVELSSMLFINVPYKWPINCNKCNECCFLCFFGFPMGIVVWVVILEVL